MFYRKYYTSISVSCFCNFLIFKNYFIDYVLQLSQFFSPLSPSIYHPPQWCRQSPHHCSCSWVMGISSLATPFPILYFTSPWLFCKYLFVLLNALTSSLIPPHPLPFGNHQNALCIDDSVSVLLVCLVCLDSVVEKCEFIATLLFIVLIFSFLNKFL